MENILMVREQTREGSASILLACLRQNFITIPPNNRYSYQTMHLQSPIDCCSLHHNNNSRVNQSQRKLCAVIFCTHFWWIQQFPTGGIDKFMIVNYIRVNANFNFRSQMIQEKLCAKKNKEIVPKKKKKTQEENMDFVPTKHQKARVLY